MAKEMSAGIRERMTVIEEIPVSSSHADNSDGDEDVIFRLSDIESVSEDDSIEEHEEEEEE